MKKPAINPVSFQRPGWSTLLSLRRMALSAAAGLSLAWAAQAQVTLQDLGPNPPTVGPQDIAQLSTSGWVWSPDGNGFTSDFGASWDWWPGQTFTTGNNAGGYTLNSVAISMAPGTSWGNYSTPQTYKLQIWVIAGQTATLLKTFTVDNYVLVDGDWLKWSGLNTTLAPNKTYAYTFGRPASGSGASCLNNASPNPYAGGEIVWVHASDGQFGYTSSHSFDSVFVLGLSAAAPNANFGMVNFMAPGGGIYQGLGAAGDAPGNTVWNVFPASYATSDPALASDGSVTPVTLSVVYDFTSGIYHSEYQGSPCFLLANAAAAGYGDGSFTFANVPDGSYSLYIYAANYDGSRGSEIMLDPQNGGGPDQGLYYTVNTLKDDHCVSLVEGNNYVLFTNVVPVNGAINGLYIPHLNPITQANGEAPLNGFQLVREQNTLNIVSQPPGELDVYAGYPVTLTVTANGSGTLHYQWQRDGADLTGATNTSYTFTTTASTNTYLCKVWNGSATKYTGATTVKGVAFVNTPTGLVVNYHFFEAWMGAYSGLAVYPDAATNTHWNGFPNNVGTPSATAVASDGSATLITLAMTYVWDSGFNTPTIKGLPCYLLTRDVYAQSPTPGTFAFNNVPAGHYSLYVYAANYDGNRGSVIQLAATNGGGADKGFSATINTLGAATNCNGFVEGDNYVLFTNVVPDATGKISGTFSPNFNPFSGTDGEAPLDAFQLVREPEPPSIVSQPAASSTVYTGNKAPLSFEVGSSVPVTYQWYHGGSPVSGATNAAFAAAPSPDAYLCVAANAKGSVTSILASVTSVAFVEPASGLVLNFQNKYLPDYTGLGVYADKPANAVWNKMSDDPHGTTGFANSSDGSPTMVTLSMIFGWISGENRDSYNGSPCFLMAKANTVDGGAPGIGTASLPTGSFTFNSVPPGKYTLYAYAANFDGTRGSLFTLAAANGGTPHNGIFATTNTVGAKNGCMDMVEGNTYVCFNDVTPDETGRISGTFIPNFNPLFGTSGEAECNALQLVKVQQPQGTLTISPAGPGHVTVTWSGGTLVSGPSLGGPWNVVSGTSPVTVSTSGAAQFFRLRY